MEAIMAMGLGERLNVVGFWLSFVGGLAALSGGALMFVGSNLAGEGVWQTLLKVQGTAEQATVPHERQWSEPVGVSVESFAPPTASQILVGYSMQASDTRTPLEMRIASEADGSGIQAFASGSSGQLSMMLVSRTIYISVSHSDIKWNVSVMGWEDGL
ncbi:hypothetical protein ACJRW5_13610 [Pseudomonas sp. SH1-B]